MSDPIEPDHEHELVNVSIPTTKKSQKRKLIKTKFNDEESDSVLEAQRAERERLERQKKKNNEADHIKQLEELYAATASSSKLPELTLEQKDFGDDDEFWKNCSDLTSYSGTNTGGQSSSSNANQNGAIEVIDISSDDEEDLKELAARRMRVPPPRNVGNFVRHGNYGPTAEVPTTSNRRQRWYYTHKELADQSQMENQYRLEEKRVKRMRSQADLEKTETLGGRLLVNSGHPDNDPDVFVAPHLTHVLQPHQLGGVRFMYDNTIESLEEYRNTSGFGCILAHSMGLGKTIQVITFTEIFLRVTKSKKVLIIMPINTIQNWYNEFDKWMPKYTTNGEQIRQFDVFIIGDTVKSFDQRVNVLEEWDERGGVLLLGYDMFRRLISMTAAKKKKPKRPTLNLNGISNPNRVPEEVVEDIKETGSEFTSGGRIKSEALQTIRNVLLDPGPDLVVCDEGHKIKNLNTDISISLGSIKTRRRIVLTGYPLQNNLLEYYCMVDFVRPKYLGEKKSFIERFEKPIKNGQCVDSTPADIHLARQRTHVLVERVKGFVQRRTHHLLKSILPDSKEYVLLLRKSNIQRQLYRSFVLYANQEMKAGTSNTFNPLKAFAACSKIWNHPDILKTMFLEREKKERAKAEASSSNDSAGSSISAEVLSAIKMNSPFGGHGAPTPTSLGNNDLNHMAQMKPPMMSSNFQPGGPFNMFGHQTMMFSPNGYQGPSQSSYGQFPLYPGHGMYPGIYGHQNQQTTFGNPFASAPSMEDKKDEDMDVKPSSSNVDGDDKRKRKRARATGVNNNNKIEDDDDLSDIPETGIRYDWAEELMSTYNKGNLENGYKLAITFDIIDECTRLNEKILVFSQNLAALAVIEEYLKRRMVARSDNVLERWEKNQNYLRFDGSTNGTDRERLINKFNNSAGFRVFLISTKAGSLGVNLVSANRCIIFDACWNPCHDAQAVCRVYRYGQQKKTFIYRLVMDNSMERAIFNRQISKHGLQQRVVDYAQVDANVTQRELETLLIYDESKDIIHDVWDTNEFELSDDVLRKVLEKDNAMLAAPPFLHESLITEREEGLSEEEKREAVLLFEREKAAELDADMEDLDETRNMGGFGMRRNWSARAPPVMTPFLGMGQAPPLKSTPMPASMIYNNGGTMVKKNGGSTVSNGVMTMRNSNSFPGAMMATPMISTPSCSKQVIVTDRDFLLSIAGDGAKVTVPQGTTVEVVKPVQGGTFIRLDDARVLDASNTVLAQHQEPDPRVPYIMRQGGQQMQRRRIDPPRPFVQLNRTTEPEVIDLD